MRRFVGIFSVSVIAIMAACNVFAATSDGVADSNIASVGYVKGAIEDLDVTDTAVTGQVVTEVSQTDGKIAVSRGTVSYNNLTDKPALKTVATTGSYNDLTNKPTIPAAQVQPDWNATTGMGAIKNKPTLGSLAAKSSVTNADIADGANIAAAKIATTKAGTGYDNMGEEAKKTAVPTVELTENIADTAAGTAVSSALKNYQPKATANYQMGNSGGTWTTMSTAQQNALNSGITSGKVSTYDGYATGKQNTLTAGSNITISGTTISAKDTVTTATKSGTGNVVTGVTATNGALTVSHGITAEETKNKTTTIAAAASASDTKYPTEKAVRTAITEEVDDFSDRVHNTLDKLNVTRVWHPEGEGVGDSTHPVYVAADGSATKIDKVAAAATADSATKATQDGDGKTITTTYVKKTELSGVLDDVATELDKKQDTLTPGSNITISGAGVINAKVPTYTASGSNGVTASVSGTVVNVAGVTATRDAVGVAKLGVIPVGTTGTATASIWVE